MATDSITVVTLH